MRWKINCNLVHVISIVVQLTRWSQYLNLWTDNRPHFIYLHTIHNAICKLSFVHTFFSRSLFKTNSSRCIRKTSDSSVFGIVALTQKHLKFLLIRYIELKWIIVLVRTAIAFHSAYLLRYFEWFYTLNLANYEPPQNVCHLFVSLLKLMDNICYV